MEILDRVKRYKQDLENPKTNGVFNLWGFLFSSFFYLYLDLLGWFLTFLFLPFLLAFPFVFVFGEIAAILIGFVLSHLISGFVASKVYQKYKIEYVKKFENVDIDINRPVEYFSISIKRLVIFTILSGGLYTIYWGYRNWKSYKETTKDDLNPFSRAYFFNLTIFSLFSKMARTLQPKKSYVIYGTLCLVCFILQSICYVLIRGESIDTQAQLVCIIFYIVLVFIYPLFLIPIQKDINQYAENHLKKSPEKKVHSWEAVVLVIGLFFSYTWVDALSVSIERTVFSKLTEEQEEKIGHIIGFVYRHTEGYSKACAKQGYEMKKYPADFKAYFAKDLDVQKAKVAEYGYALDDNDVEEVAELESAVEETVLKELEELRKIYIRFMISEHEKKPLEEIGWNDEWKDLLSLKDVCEIFDEDGIEMLKSGTNKNFINERGL